jgi:hypothetical protein
LSTIFKTNKSMKKALLLCGFMVLKMAAASHGQNLIDSTWTLNTSIPVGNPVGVPSSETFQNLSNDPIGSVDVTLDISGGYNGALYGYLVLQNANGNTATETLLNQVGTLPSNTFGSAGAGMDVTLSDTGTANGSIHNATGTPTGLWQPDSANTLNGTFGGMTANGTWTLFLADLDAGTPAPTLVSWGLDVNASPVPEPASGWMAGFGGLVLLAGQRLIRNRKQSSKAV